MTRRNIDPCFSVNERLWRRFEWDDFDRINTKIKTRGIKLQCSIYREKYCKISQVTYGKWNGIAQIDVQSLNNMVIDNQYIKVDIVDQPLDGQDGHSIIAITLATGKSYTDADINRIKFQLVNAMTVIQKPIKIK